MSQIKIHGICVVQPKKPVHHTREHIVSLVFFFFFFFLSKHESYHKVEMSEPIPLKFGTQKCGVRAHLGTMFGKNTINTRQVICNYSRKTRS